MLFKKLRLFYIQIINEYTLHASLIFLNNGIMTDGPLAQFKPTTEAPASSKCRHASGIGTSSTVRSGAYAVRVITAGQPE